ncbi:Cilia- and flagella-associated protein 99, partial [Dissostichus eleginoides]
HFSRQSLPLVSVSTAGPEQIPAQAPNSGPHTTCYRLTEYDGARDGELDLAFDQSVRYSMGCGVAAGEERREEAERRERECSISFLLTHLSSLTTSSHSTTPLSSFFTSESIFFFLSAPKCCQSHCLHEGDVSSPLTEMKRADVLKDGPGGHFELFSALSTRQTTSDEEQSAATASGNPVAGQDGSQTPPRGAEPSGCRVTVYNAGFSPFHALILSIVPEFSQLPIPVARSEMISSTCNTSFCSLGATLLLIKQTTHGERRKHAVEKEIQRIKRQRGEELTVLLSQRVKNEM